MYVAFAYDLEDHPAEGVDVVVVEAGLGEVFDGQHFLDVGQFDAHEELFVADQDAFEEDFALELLADTEQAGETDYCGRDEAFLAVLSDVAQPRLHYF